MSDKAISGGCQCGAIRYEIEGELPSPYCCHCGECKKQSASAFSFSIGIPFARLSVVGEPAVFQTIGLSGAAKNCYFCASCGTRMWHRSTRAPDHAALKAGTLDEPEGISPAYHLWTSRKLDWVVIDPAVPAFETQPNSAEEMREAMELARSGVARERNEA